MTTHAGSADLNEADTTTISPPDEQAAMRARWADHIAERLECLDLGQEFQVYGRPYATLAADGSVVIHNAEALKHRTG